MTDEFISRAEAVSIVQQVIGHCTIAILELYGLRRGDKTVIAATEFSQEPSPLKEATIFDSHTVHENPVWKLSQIKAVSGTRRLTILFPSNKKIIERIKKYFILLYKDE